MSDVLKLTLSEARDALKAKKISARELTQAYLARCEAHKDWNAFITPTSDLALKAADASDAKLKAGQGGALEGIPLAIKDLFCTEGTRTTAGSKILENFVPPYESSVTQKLKDAGGIFLGKTNLDEFAMGSSNMTSHFGPVKNPWKKKPSPSGRGQGEGLSSPSTTAPHPGPLPKGEGEDLVPGGSSGGSATAVAGKLCLAATGTDTGGSIRQPAAFCGIVGIKPTYGRCSRWGTVAFASSLDQAGMFARNVRDAAITMQVICGHDPKDSTSAKHAVPDFEKALTGNIKGLKIGIPKEYRIDGTDPEILAMWDKGVEWCKAAGAQVVEISLPHTKYSLATYYIIAPAEASSNLARYDGMRYGFRAPEAKSLEEVYEKTRAQGFGEEVKRRILIGTYVLSAGYYDAYYKKAQRVRYLIRQDFIDAFTKVDAILTPTAPSAAFAMGENMNDPVAMYLNDVFTVPTSLAGLPAIALPASLNKDGLPLGLQVIGKAFDEEMIFRVAGALEEAAQFKAEPL